MCSSRSAGTTWSTPCAGWRLEGLTNRRIGERTILADKTVKNYVSSLPAKLGLERRTQAAVFATRHRPPTEQPRR